MVESLLFIGAEAGAKVGAGEKNTRSQSPPKTDRLHNTAQEDTFSSSRDDEGTVHSLSNVSPNRHTVLFCVPIRTHSLVLLRPSAAPCLIQEAKPSPFTVTLYEDIFARNILPQSSWTPNTMTDLAPWWWWSAGRWPPQSWWCPWSWWRGCPPPPSAS